MSKYDTNPIGALEERFQSQGITPQYRELKAEGASHTPTFNFEVILGDQNSKGRGNSKKQGKEAAARAMLDKLDGPQDGNTVGALQEFCVKHGYPMPTYEPGDQPHSFICCVNKWRESGAGDCKKDAKKEAAQKMMKRLKFLVPNSSKAP